MPVTPSLELVSMLTGMLEIFIHACNDNVLPLHRLRAQGLSSSRPALGRGRDKKKNNPRKEVDTFFKSFRSQSRDLPVLLSHLSLTVQTLESAIQRTSIWETNCLILSSISRKSEILCSSQASYIKRCTCNIIQSKPVNTDNKGVIESVLIQGVSVLSGLNLGKM